MISLPVWLRVVVPVETSVVVTAWPSLVSVCVVVVVLPSVSASEKLLVMLLDMLVASDSPVPVSTKLTVCV